MTTRVVTLGAGFGGINAALAFDREERVGLDVMLIDQNNFFLFTPMLAEVAASGIETLNIVSPIRRLFKRVRFMEAEIEGADLEARTVRVRVPTGHQQEVPYDHLIVELGSVYPTTLDSPVWRRRPADEDDRRWHRPA
jgi:NADH dehydrogenase